jgi:hypothetical protein
MVAWHSSHKVHDIPLCSIHCILVCSQGSKRVTALSPRSCETGITRVLSWYSELNPESSGRSVAQDLWLSVEAPSVAQPCWYWKESSRKLCMWIENTHKRNFVSASLALTVLPNSNNSEANCMTFFSAAITIQFKHVAYLMAGDVG